MKTLLIAAPLALGLMAGPPAASAMPTICGVESAPPALDCSRFTQAAIVPTNWAPLNVGLAPPGPGNPPPGQEFDVHSFFDVFVEIQLDNGQNIGVNTDTSGNTGPNVAIDSITLQLSGSETIGQVGFMVSDTLIPLSELNNIGNDAYQYTLPVPYSGAYSVNAVPEPGTLALFGMALLALGGLSLRRKFA